MKEFRFCEVDIKYTGEDGMSTLEKYGYDDEYSWVAVYKIDGKWYAVEAGLLGTALTLDE